MPSRCPSAHPSVRTGPFSPAATCARAGRGSASTARGAWRSCASSPSSLSSARATRTWAAAAGTERTERHRTNITEEHAQYASTRGELASSFLLPRDPAQGLDAHVRALVAQNVPYAGFNLLLLAPRGPPPSASAGGAPRTALAYDGAFVTNHGGGGRVASRPLSDAERGCGALSNGVDGRGAAAWPKVQHGAASFSALLQAVTRDTPEADLVERLFGLLT